MDHNCIWCKILIRQRDKARDDLGRAIKGKELNKFKALKLEVQKMQKALERKNKELDAMHFVWCDGGCSTGVHRFDELGPEAITEKIVEMAERNTRRLRRWYETFKYRREHYSEGG